jgi:hypothetical protein
MADIDRRLTAALGRLGPLEIGRTHTVPERKTYMLNGVISWKALRRRLMPLLCLTGGILAQGSDKVDFARTSSVVHARAILGLEKISSNATGELSIQDGALLFRTSGGRTARIPMSFIRDVFLSQEDKQVGGTPMALGRAAAPFSAGRAIALLAHKKYDFLTLEYRDANDGLHGVICQLNKGQGQIFIEELEKKGVHVSGSKGNTAEQKRGDQQ